MANKLYASGTKNSEEKKIKSRSAYKSRSAVIVEIRKKPNNWSVAIAELSSTPSASIGKKHSVRKDYNRRAEEDSIRAD